TGEIYYDRGRYQDAAHEFEEAYRLSNKPELLYNMGKSYDGLGDQARALDAYRHFLKQVSSSPDRETVQKRVEALSKLVGTIVIKVPNQGATVRLDDKEIGVVPFTDVIEANPGAHLLEVSQEGYATLRQKIVVAPAATLEVATPLKSLVKVVEVR